MLTIDGSFGEGGGQVLRSSLALSLVTGNPFRIVDIRRRRSRPGLRKQHLTAVGAAAAVGGATVTEVEVGSLELTFAPRLTAGGNYTFSIGTAGSTTLVLQTILPALMLAPEASTVILEGGTHNPQSPTFEFLERAYLPLVRRMGPNVSATLERPGFYPAGGGRMVVSIKPNPTLRPLNLLDRGPIREHRAKASVANLPRHIAEREIETLLRKLRWDRSCFAIEELTDVDGPGNVVIVELIAEHVTEVFAGFGQKGVPAEAVARHLGAEVKEYLRADVPVGRYLGDQLVLLNAVAGGGTFRTLSPTTHLTTQLAVIREFLGSKW
ncbi:MAG: RNA 3'-terminal phosphate cyclase, partial [Myxococcales bacterium]|nr:RNA 3'-terminal phosphate cyclase [Myxococcales bacterium]